MNDILLQNIRASLPEIRRIRQHLHRHPELSWQEKETARFIRDWLAENGIEHLISDELHATVAILRGNKAQPVIGLRADIDALPIEEKSEVDYKSRHRGVMHACGHDGHTAILMGCVKAIDAVKDQLPGTVVCVFQPAEEQGGGGDHLLRSGILDDFNISGFLALHAWPYLPAGTIGFRYGPMMAGIDDFKITVHGKTGHAAHPLTAIDPIWISSQIITGVQSLITREKHGADPAVISFTQINGGVANNVIPAGVEMIGTIRTLQPETRERLRRRFNELVESISRSFGGSATVEIIVGYPPVVNHKEMVDLVTATGRSLLGAEKVTELAEPSMGGEDFGYYLQRFPGAMFRLGVGPNASLHSDQFNFNDEALETGIQMMTSSAVTFLQKDPFK